MAEDFDNGAPQAPTPVGAQLRAAREAAGLSREDVAARTRITERHLAAIENGNLASLPGRTYAVGFSRSYAKAVGLDANSIAALARVEFAAEAKDEPQAESKFEPGDPSRVPSRTLAWAAAAAGFIVVIAVFAAKPELFFPEATMPSLVAEASPPEAKPAAVAANAAPNAAQNAAVQASGPVMFTALQDRIWVKFTDAAGTQLMQKEMALGETYTVPAEAAGPVVRTARPDALQVTIGGKPVPPLAAEQQMIRDMPVSAEALLARPAPAPVAGPAAPAA